MGFFSFLTRNANKNAKTPTRAQPDFSSTTSGIMAKDASAFVCIDKIASQFAGLNFGIYKTSDRQKAKNHELYSVLKQPNADDRKFNFLYQSAIDYFNGGCFWYVAKVKNEVVSLFRLNRAAVLIKRNERTMRREYYYNGVVYSSDNIIYIPSRFNYSTLTGGQSIFNANPSAFNTADSLETFTQSAFSNGMSGKRTVIDVSGAYPDLTKEQAIEIKNNFQNEYSGAQNAGRPLLKKKGIEYSEIGSASDNNGAQLRENREFQKALIESVFQLPSESYDIEKYFLMLNEFALRPMATQFEEAINSLLDEDKYFFEFDFNGVMKSSLSNRIEAYNKQINIGIISPNEARRKENLPPIEAGDNHFMPVNLMPLNDETINAYMAKQKNEIDNSNPTDPDAQHFAGGDDKQ